MKTLTLALIMAVAAPVLLPQAAHAKDKTAAATEKVPAGLSKEEAKKWREHMLVKTHLTKHVKYPATRAELLNTCKGMREVKASDKKWVEETLPEKTYNSAEEVEEALGWEKAEPVKAEPAPKK